MPENRRAAAIALAFAFLPAPGRADGAADDLPVCCNVMVDSYRNYTRQALDRCRRSVRLRPRESVETDDSAKLRNCIAAGARESRARLTPALRALRTREAREALRHYHDIFENALAGVEPTLEEPVAAYEQRQSSLRHSLAHAWTRFELEER